MHHYSVNQYKKIIFESLNAHPERSRFWDSDDYPGDWGQVGGDEAGGQ
jgi:hypothetical protein